MVHHRRVELLNEIPWGAFLNCWDFMILPVLISFHLGSGSTGRKQMITHLHTPVLFALNKTLHLLKSSTPNPNPLTLCPHLCRGKGSTRQMWQIILNSGAKESETTMEKLEFCIMLLSAIKYMQKHGSVYVSSFNQKLLVCIASIQIS